MSGPDSQLLNHLLNPDEQAAAVAALPDWTLTTGGEGQGAGQRLRRCFVFADFAAAMGFMVRAGFAAERLCHHPNWSNVYNRVEVEIWSHDLGGVSALCVALARAFDEAA